MDKKIENNDCNCSHADCKSNHHNDNCNCGHEHVHTNQKPKLVKMCVLEDGVRCTNCGACDMCDLDPNKICDNCGKCLDMLNTNEKGFVEVPIDKIIMGENADEELNQLLSLYGLDDEDEDEE